ncbi:NHL repeat-containing protein [Neptunitalea lumnitzerae]|uniref:Uncharacterized protein n=1 Tax=Neptunitalea lumnitzerae TaxID=2965509 RepID=A0ABQ5MHY1_9FLAO|nr:hypothetical protein [Neptunitalea sp. Y10]GLB48537.1 hypothetical protein Y10_09050 [Neptunitalea sp. Y10]
MKKLIAIAFLILTSCTNYGQIHTLTKITKKLKENSGLAITGKDSYWVIEDSGNDNAIYKLSEKGKMAREIEIENAKNVDWEELTMDDDGNVYIGDFGNNRSERKNLAIYIISNPDKIEKKKTKAKKITFSYPEQKDFPAKDEDKIFDCEAFFYLNGQLYLFTKDRSNPYAGRCFLYTIPATPGDYKATYLATHNFGKDYHTGSITAADISPDKTKVALLTHKHLYIYSDFTGSKFFEGKLTVLDLEDNSQKESVAFKDNRTLLISDEASKKDAKLYEVTLP